MTQNRIEDQVQGEDLLPSLAVVIPCYNGAQFLEERLSSILSQSKKPDELIIVDDGSTDESREIVKKYQQLEPDIVQLIENGENKGVVFSFNRGAQQAKSEYLTGLSVNDLALPGFFEKSLRLLQKYPQAGLCCSFSTSKEGFSEKIWPERPWFSLFHEPQYIPKEVLPNIIAKTSLLIAGHTAIYRKDLLLAYAVDSLEALKWHYDWFINYAIGFRHGVCLVPESLAIWQSFSDNYCSNMNSPKLQTPVLFALAQLLNLPENQDLKLQFSHARLLEALFVGYEEFFERELIQMGGGEFSRLDFWTYYHLLKLRFYPLENKVRSLEMENQSLKSLLDLQVAELRGRVLRLEQLRERVRKKLKGILWVRDVLKVFLDRDR